MMRARVNPFFEPGRPGEGLGPETREVRAFHESLPEYAPTPLHCCAGLAAELGIGVLYVKDESQRFGLDAFKALGASWAIEQLRRSGGGAGGAGGAPPRTLAAATDGNHGRAVAWAARRLGLEAVIFIPAAAAPARVESIRREGAQVELVEGTYDEALTRCAAASEARGWQVVSDAGYEGYLEIPRWIAAGYATLFEEADEQLAAAGLEPPDLVLIQAGVGALLHVAVRHFRAKSSQPVLVAVEPVEADALCTSISAPDGTATPTLGKQNSIMAGLNCGQVSLSAWPEIRRGVELFMTISDEYAERAMRLLARPPAGDPPIVAGETGAAGLAGLLALGEAAELAEARRFLALGPNRRVMVINTEGATDPIGYRRIVGNLVEHGEW